MRIRQIKKTDNATLAKIIREVLTEFNANRAGTVFYDSSTDALFELFQMKGAHYFVVEDANGKLLGGAGVFPSANLPSDTCELVKMYLLPEGRGKGYGKQLIEKCIIIAQEEGFKRMYLETMPELKQSIAVYEKSGFHFLNQAIGNSEHFGCDVWMIKNIKD